MFLTIFINKLIKTVKVYHHALLKEMKSAPKEKEINVLLQF